MKVDFIRRTPRTVGLIGKRLSRSNGAEEIHSPVCALGLALVHVEITQRYLHIGIPQLIGPVYGRVCGELVCIQIGNVEPAKGCPSGSNLGRVVDEGGEGDIIWRDLEFQVGLGVIGALVLP